jgi:mannose-6-phosphate isomerase-like protein (cupin superfamily)
MMSIDAGVARSARHGEFYTHERLYITELSNTPSDPALSIAQARVEVGVTTALHRLNGVQERYVILKGRGLVEVGQRPPEQVGPGDVVIIPAGVPQRIKNVGSEDLIFLCVCTPRFFPDSYEDLERASPGDVAR